MLVKQAFFFFFDWAISFVFLLEILKQNKQKPRAPCSHFASESCLAARVLAGTEYEEARVQGSVCHLSPSPRDLSMVPLSLQQASCLPVHSPSTSSFQPQLGKGQLSALLARDRDVRFHCSCNSVSAITLLSEVFFSPSIDNNRVEILYQFPACLFCNFVNNWTLQPRELERWLSPKMHVL